MSHLEIWSDRFATYTDSVYLWKKHKEISGTSHEMISRNMKLRTKVYSSMDNNIFVKRGENMYTLVFFLCMEYHWKFVFFVFNVNLYVPRREKAGETWWFGEQILSRKILTV